MSNEGKALYKKNENKKLTFKQMYGLPWKLQIANKSTNAWIKNIKQYNGWPSNEIPEPNLIYPKTASANHMRLLHVIRELCT